MTNDTEFLENLAKEAAEAEAPPDSLEKLQALAAEAATLKTEVETLSEQVAEKNKRIWEIRTKQMVELFQESKTDTLGLPDAGLDFYLENFYKARITDANRDFVFTWLDEHGHGDLLKQVVEIQITKDAQDLVDALMMFVNDQFLEELQTSVDNLAGLVPEEHRQFYTILRERLEPLLSVRFGDRASISSERTVPWKRYESFMIEQYKLRQDPEVVVKEDYDPEAGEVPPLPIASLGMEVGLIVNIKERKEGEEKKKKKRR